MNEPYTYGIVYAKGKGEIRLRLQATSWFEAKRIAEFCMPEGWGVYGVFFKNVGLSHTELEEDTEIDYPLVFEEVFKDKLQEYGEAVGTELKAKEQE